METEPDNQVVFSGPLTVKEIKTLLSVKKPPELIGRRATISDSEPSRKIYTHTPMLDYFVKEQYFGSDDEPFVSFTSEYFTPNETVENRNSNESQHNGNSDEKSTSDPCSSNAPNIKVQHCSVTPHKEKETELNFSCSTPNENPQINCEDEESFIDKVSKALNLNEFSTCASPAGYSNVKVNKIMSITDIGENIRESQYIDHETDTVLVSSDDDDDHTNNFNKLHVVKPAYNNAQANDDSVIYIGSDSDSSFEEKTPIKNKIEKERSQAENSFLAVDLEHLNLNTSDVEIISPVLNNDPISDNNSFDEEKIPIINEVEKQLSRAENIFVAEDFEDCDSNTSDVEIISPILTNDPISDSNSFVEEKIPIKNEVEKQLSQAENISVAEEFEDCDSNMSDVEIISPITNDPISDSNSFDEEKIPIKNEVEKQLRQAENIFVAEDFENRDVVEIISPTNDQISDSSCPNEERKPIKDEIGEQLSQTEKFFKAVDFDSTPPDTDIFSRQLNNDLLSDGNSSDEEKQPIKDEVERQLSGVESSFVTDDLENLDSVTPNVPIISSVLNYDLISDSGSSDEEMKPIKNEVEEQLSQVDTPQEENSLGAMDMENFDSAMSNVQASSTILYSSAINLHEMNVPKIVNSTYTESCESVSSSRYEFNDTLEEMEMALRNGLDYAMPEETNTNSETAVSSLNVNTKTNLTPSLGSNTMNMKEVTRKTKKTLIPINTSAKSYKGVSSSVRSIKHDFAFKIPPKPASVRKTPNLNNILSPVAMYIKNTPKVPQVQHIAPKPLAASCLFPKSTDSKVVYKENEDLPARVYKPAKRAFTSKDRELKLPASIKKHLLHTPDIIKHKGRIGKKENNSASLEAELLSENLTVSFDNASLLNASALDVQDISMLTTKKAYIK